MDLEVNLRSYLDGGTNSDGREPNAGYASFDYCFNYFQPFRDSGNVCALASPGVRYSRSRWSNGGKGTDGSATSSRNDSGTVRSGERRNMQELEVYSMIGAEGFTRLVAAFYRQVPQDDLLGPMYPATDLPGAEQRLRDFLIGRFGGPQTYIAQRGHPRLRARHSPFHIDQAARDRWMRLMNSAFGEAALPAEAEQVLRKFLDGMSSLMINQSEARIS